MKKITLILFAVGLIFTAQSQNKPHFIAVNIGASIPMGDYADTDGDNENAGFAATGANFAIEGAGFINETVGFGGYIGGNSHNIDEDAYTSELNAIPGISHSTIVADPYGVANYMAGIYISFPASENVFFRFKMLGGMFLATQPDMTVTVTNDYGETAVLNMTETIGSKFTGLFGGSVLFKVSPRLSIAGNLEYSSAECEFDFHAGTGTSSYKQVFTILNITAGLNITLGHLD